MKAQLLEAAQLAMARAYAPYSNFHVGAAVLAQNGKIYAGCNVENAAYPQGNCAEVSAIAHMVMEGQTRIEEVAVAGPGPGLATPCGGCRQCLREFADDETLIHVCSPDGALKTFTLAQLLPNPFSADDLQNTSQP